MSTSSLERISWFIQDWTSLFTTPHYTTQLKCPGRVHAFSQQSKMAQSERVSCLNPERIIPVMLINPWNPSDLYLYGVNSYLKQSSRLTQFLDHKFINRSVSEACRLCKEWAFVHESDQLFNTLIDLCPCCSFEKLFICISWRSTGDGRTSSTGWIQHNVSITFMTRHYDTVVESWQHLA